MYQSPIEIIQKELVTQYENGILKAVQDVGILCDAGELTKALMYDRNQYEKGYKDRDAEIIRCKDCKYYRVEPNGEKWCGHLVGIGICGNSYCSDAERKTDRDCSHCTHHTEQGCTKWECEYERRTE